MKLKKGFKSMISYVLVAAMVIASLAGYQAKNVSAAVDYSTLTYEAIPSQNAAGSVSWAKGSDNQSVDFSYAVLTEESKGDIVDWMTTGAGGLELYGDQWMSVTWHGNYPDAVANINGTDVVAGNEGVAVANNVQANVQTSVLFVNNAYNLVKVTSADGSQYITFVVKVGTPTTGEAPTQGETASVEVTEPETDADGFIALNTEEWVNMGAWTTYFGVSWANATGAYKGGAALNDFTLKVLTNNYSGYGIQAKATGIETEAGKTYQSTIKFTSDKGGFDIATKIDGITDEVAYSVVEGENVINTTFTATAAKTDVFFNLTGVAEGTTFVFTEVSVAEAGKTPEMIEKERVEAKLTSEQNIALGKTAFASSTAAEDAYLAGEAFDGNLQSRWAAGTYEEGEYVGVDLGAVKNVASVALSWEGAYATSYDIEVSTDGETYNKVKTVTATKAEVIEVVLDEEVEAQYVRIVCNGNGLPYPYSIWEIGVFEAESQETPTEGETESQETPTEGETESQETPTEGETESQETPTEGETESQEIPTEGEMTFVECVVNEDGDETRHEAGNYKYYVGKWNGSTAQIAVDPANPDHIKAQQLSSLWYDAWGFQIEMTKSGLEPGKTYTIQVDMEASVADGTFKTNASDDVIDVVAGVNQLTRTVEADENGDVNITVGLGWVGTAVILDFSNVVVTEVKEDESETPTSADEDETPTSANEDETPTSAGTVETTAPATVETTTASAATETTTAPKAQETTTVAPTTKGTDVTAAATVKKPAKAKIKKVTAKKKAAKTVKLTLKKVSRAVGYQVQVSKAKKFTKKNILVKKIVKKVKPTIKSKKLANKKKLYVRARAYVLDANGKKVYGKWSKVKKVTIK